MWPDESCFNLFCTDGRCQNCLEPHKAMNPSCVTRTVQGSAQSIMIWGMFCWYGNGVHRGYTNSDEIPRSTGRSSALNG
ncbi:hypothetical protein TNCV_350351 [Trichonephila clavipes]|nr:hypothetical protein TNCV_350351 [Trichonephila clavipes]